jgi:polyisoprenyl-teichoic acid--peptidoglycan teichoic acid transferase
MNLTENQQRVKKSLFKRFAKFIPDNREPKKRKVALFLALLVICGGSYIIYSTTNFIYQYATNFSAAELLFALAGDLEQDKEGRTNILLLGAGGGDHDGADLTDTMIVASLNAAKGTLGMVSIPRDLWIDIPGYQSSRINKIYENLKPKYGSSRALQIFKEGMENISGMEIPYYVKIDFKAFKEVIDIVGGIEIDVPKRIYDTAYPRANQNGYETFTIEAGNQILDGKTALKYARSRHSTSDFDRAERQQLIIEAIKKKVTQLELFSSPLRIKQLYEQFGKNVETNLKISELITLARTAKEFGTESITAKVIKDQDIVQTGSFLYTPPREEYGGAFVLIPEGETFTEMQNFIQMVFDYPEIFTSEPTLQILNGTKNPGIATHLYKRLIPYGLVTEDIGNTETRGYETTQIIVNNKEKAEPTTSILKNLFLPYARDAEQDPAATILPKEDITIILGEDYFKELDWAK